MKPVSTWKALKRSSYWVTRKAISAYLEKEEAEKRDQETDNASEYQQGLSVGNDDMAAWLDSWWIDMARFGYSFCSDNTAIIYGIDLMALRLSYLKI